jgi:hypothetical protein
MVFFATLILAAFFLALLALYMLPTIVAHKRNHHHTFLIGVVNLVFGCTFLGWILCLIWAHTTPYQAPNQTIIIQQQVN